MHISSINALKDGWPELMTILGLPSKDMSYPLSFGTHTQGKTNLVSLGTKTQGYDQPYTPILECLPRGL